MDKIIAIDFDGTLCEEAFPKIGTPNKALIGALKQLKNSGHKLILWTCRNGELLEEATEWCAAYGLTFDAINANLPEILEQYNGKDSRKITYDILIDDRNVEINNINKQDKDVFGIIKYIQNKLN